MNKFFKGVLAGAILSSLAWSFTKDALGVAFMSFILGAITLAASLFLAACIGTAFEKVASFFEKMVDK
jgi:hypothetical protein